MFPFKPLDVSDLEIVNEYVNINKFVNSEYCFSTFFSWQKPFKIEFTIIENCLCGRGRWAGFEYHYMPLGKDGDVYNAVIALKDHCENEKKPLVLLSVSDDMIEQLDKIGLKDDFRLEERPEFFDYVYKRDKLINLHGKKLHGRRNHLNYFLTNYKYSMEDITEGNSAACREMLIRAIDDRSEDAADEIDVTLDAFDNREGLRLIGSALTVGGEIAGVILAEDVNKMAVIQIAKADVSFRGASVALFKFFLENNMTDCENINFMDDMGIEGLRTVKLSYAPDFFIKKYALWGK